MQVHSFSIQTSLKKEVKRMAKRNIALETPLGISCLLISSSQKNPQNRIFCYDFED